MRKQRRQMAGAAAALLAAGLLTGCGGSQNADTVTSLKIGVSVYDQYDTFLAEMMTDMAAELKNLEQETNIQITMEVVNAGHSQLTQNDQVQDFLDSDYDILCVNLVDRTDASTIIDKAKNADTPVIFFNRELVGEDLQRWDKLYYVGADALESGLMEGQLVADACAEDMEAVDRNGDGKLQYVILEGEAGHQDALVRTEYALKAVTESGIAVDRLADEIANWNRGQAQTKMSQWLESYRDEIEVVFANNDDMALGAIDALKESDVEHWPLVVGIDGTDVALDAVDRHELYGTVLNDAKGQARAMLALAFSIGMDTPLSDEFTLQDGKYIRLPYEQVTYANLEEIRLKKE